MLPRYHLSSQEAIFDPVKDCVCKTRIQKEGAAMAELH